MLAQNKYVSILGILNWQIIWLCAKRTRIRQNVNYDTITNKPNIDNALLRGIVYSTFQLNKLCRCFESVEIYLPNWLEIFANWYQCLNVSPFSHFLCSFFMFRSLDCYELNECIHLFPSKITFSSQLQSSNLAVQIETIRPNVQVHFYSRVGEKMGEIERTSERKWKDKIA